MVVERRAVVCVCVCVWEGEKGAVSRGCVNNKSACSAGVETDVPSWKGRRGRLAAAREWRIKIFEAILVGRARRLRLAGDG